MRVIWNVGSGFKKYIDRLDRLQHNCDDLIEKAIYPGAGLIADELRKAIEALPVIDRNVRETGPNTVGGKSVQKEAGQNKAAKPHKGAPRGVTKLEKEGLLEGFGLAPIREDAGKKGGYINTKAGMDGYNKHITAQYPKGHPNAMIARSVESGTSFRQKTPFIAPTVRKYKDHAERLIAKEFDALADKL